MDKKKDITTSLSQLVKLINTVVGDPPDYGVVNIELKYQDRKVVNMKISKALSYRYDEGTKKE